VKVFFQLRLQIGFDHRLRDSVRDSWHGYFELHFGPVRLWDRPR
jgi:hypothetical protein